MTITYHQALVTIDTLEAIGEPVPAKLRSMVYNHVAKLGRQLKAVPGCELPPAPKKETTKVKPAPKKETTKVKPAPKKETTKVKPAPKKRQRTKGNVPAKKQAPMPTAKLDISKFMASRK